jgi:DNA-binding MltR family transcriptional regulator
MLDVATKLRLGLVVEPEEAAEEIEQLQNLLRRLTEQTTGLWFPDDPTLLEEINGVLNAKKT